MTPAMVFSCKPILLTALVSLATTVALAADAKQYVYIGTYTRGSDSKGIYLFELDPQTGEMTPRGVAAETVNPSFLALGPDGKWLVSVTEVDKQGGVGSFAIDPKTGKLTPINQQVSGGAGPCHVTVDRDGRCVLVANYGGGSVAALPIDDSGKLSPASSFHQHQGSSVNPQRQTAPHAHSVNVAADNRHAVVADLGVDKLLVYQLDAKSGELTPKPESHFSVAPGAGPRHFAFHPNGKWAYAINELASTVTAMRYDADTGKFTEIATVSTLPDDFEGNNTTAEVQVHPSGKFLYGSNRGHDSLALFEIDPQTGGLSPSGHTPTGGKTPRNFGIDPTGQIVIAANQDSNSLVVFRVDPQTGKLAPAGVPIDVPRPCCVKFLPISAK